MSNNKQTTALDDHLIWLRKQLRNAIDDGESISWIYAYRLAIKNAESLLDKEADIIIKAYEEDYLSGETGGPRYLSGAEYYNAKFADDN